MSDDEERETDLDRVWGLLMQPGYLPELVLERPAWQHQAACRGVDVSVFFPVRGNTGEHAYELCAVCPVRVECLEYALADDTLAGVWGGTSTVERRRLRREAA